MKIGIDASRINVEQKTGVENYSHEVIKRLISDRKNNYLLWCNKHLPNEFRKNNTAEKIVRQSRLWTQFGLALGTYCVKTDVTFIPSHVIPIFGRGRYVITIHDLAFDYFPELYTKRELIYHHLAVRIALFKSKSIIVPSQTTKDDLIKLYHASSDNIYVIPHGVDHHRFKVNNSRHEKPLDFGIKKPYILYAGRIEKKKNLINLVKAYNLIRQESNLNHQLVLVGKPGSGFTQIESIIHNLPANISRDIILTGYVVDRTYQEILSHADIFVMPSWYEGFGMPILEAMACGVPTVVNDTACLKELVGESGLVVDCSKPFPLAAKLSYLIHHKDYYLSLRKKGLIRSKKYTWEASALKTKEVLEMAML